MQATPSSPLFEDPMGLGVLWIDHLVPFQCSASVAEAVLLADAPTAVQELLEGQATPSRKLFLAPVGLRVL
jgi:hypothetical protein